MKHFLSIILSTAAISVSVLFTACHEADDTFMGNAGDPVLFGASLQEIENVRTRADETDGVSKFDSVHIATAPFDMDFYIQLYCPDTEKTKLGIYHVPSGNVGRLEPNPRTDENTLKWMDLDSDHVFYSWNIPWNGAPNYSEENWKPELKDGKLDPFKIEFHDSPEGEDGFDKYKNNSIYENFIGAKSVSHSYRQHGRYVDLTFHHLVSKIIIRSFKLIGTDGSIQEHLKANVTFVGMPTEAMFYPHPEDDGRPRIIVEKDMEEFEDGGLTYFIDNRDNSKVEETVFYICPEVDFSNIDFKVKITDVNYQHKDVFYGTFDDVVFKRTPGAAYDQGDDVDSKILHAGEMMTLDIVLIPGIGPGLSVIIGEWSTEDRKETQYHQSNGIYSEADVRSLLDAFLNQKQEGQGGTTKEEIEHLFDMYGEEREETTANGETVKRKYFPLYENVDIHEHTNGNIFPIPDGYILDGMGHTIMMKTNRGYNGDFGSTQTYFNIGPVRNVYLTDGNNTIYIDNDGFVWIKDPEKPGDYQKTEYQLTDFVNGQKSYDISCETGIVHKSTYYNNNIVGS